MSADNVVRLEKSPAMSGLYVRALLRRTDGQQDLPTLAVELDDQRVDMRHVQHYRHICGFSGQGPLPISYPHMLAFPLHLALMTDKAFPFPLLGLVHVSNRIEQLRPVWPREVLRVKCYLGELKAHPKGQTFSIHSEIWSGRECCWRSESVNLFRGAPVSGPQAVKSNSIDTLDGLVETDRWPLPSSLGRAYGRISGDINPIHLHPLSAKLFGFERHIAHGMWLKARTLAKLLPTEERRAVQVAVEFKRPVFLPAELSLREASRSETKKTFALYSADGSELHLQGQLDYLRGV
ncbi:MaoC/PaaZ C-terminal domain-containing protein [Atopomonas sediminilitoris]|uniref:MaoC/PaaZ C-terminal domain-containing protein n=1 Tax=Atopomonas sediminilitoris TaxID=2919919 RepID=UPI001F4D5011|nr:MaoC/PaaZ C-terminal domain-containing protein [Atopomonas sediminilitoris]MCJ8169418.1 acyl dehydratase [Atopomonas sediminilitoris]